VTGAATTAAVCSAHARDCDALRRRLAEQVFGPDGWFDGAHRPVWDRQCRELGASEAELEGARERMRHDRCAAFESQLRWLRSAGSPSADCVFKSWRFAVIAAFKEADR
jgi:tRNA (cmo5U34)-methyltransferase